MVLDPIDPLRSVEVRAKARVVPDDELAFRLRVGEHDNFPVPQDSPPHVVVTFVPTKVRAADYRRSEFQTGD